MKATFRNKEASFTQNLYPLPNSLQSYSGDVRSWRLLAQVAGKLLNVLPNAADPERVFSELGRMITPSRTNLEDAQSARMIFIAADCRVQ
jgi:hypothetical protein